MKSCFSQEKLERITADATSRLKTVLTSDRQAAAEKVQSELAKLPAGPRGGKPQLPHGNLSVSGFATLIVQADLESKLQSEKLNWVLAQENKPQGSLVIARLAHLGSANDVDSLIAKVDKLVSQKKVLAIFFWGRGEMFILVTLSYACFRIYINRRLFSSAQTRRKTKLKPPC